MKMKNILLLTLLTMLSSSRLTAQGSFEFNDSAENPPLIFSGPSRGWEPLGGPASSLNGPGPAIGYTRRPGGPARRPGAWGCSRIIWRLGPWIESPALSFHILLA